MKPQLTKRPVTANAIEFRVLRALARRDLMVVKRSKSPIGPLFTIDLQKGVVVDQQVPSFAALARRYGLIRAGERVTP